ncbi:SRPBCC domain-containing protein [Cellulomonas soli]|uniref:SRPBCC domain-containing protein n=1 Tax=Cellulomonas soli TaxID=931535 RepID=UPI0017C5A828|nr:SRPBCC domain-containing protein [Cellulomonas soli]NYI57380.1 uncharacterized protein YndB with AHSA1/START domain [Cellulomonas soli]
MGEPDGAPDLELTRVMAAPAAAIWAAWLDPSAVAAWWGPDGFTSTVRLLELRDGGRFEVVMHSPDGTDYENLYLFDEVRPTRGLTYVHQGSEEWGLGPSRTVVLLDEDEALPRRTRVTMRTSYASDEDRRRHLEDFHAADGARQLLERLERVATSGRRAR